MGILCVFSAQRKGELLVPLFGVVLGEFVRIPKDSKGIRVGTGDGKWFSVSVESISDEFIDAPSDKVLALSVHNRESLSAQFIKPNNNERKGKVWAVVIKRTYSLSMV